MKNNYLIETLLARSEIAGTSPKVTRNALAFTRNYDIIRLIEQLIKNFYGTTKKNNNGISLIYERTLQTIRMYFSILKIYSVMYGKSFGSMKKYSGNTNKSSRSMKKSSGSTSKSSRSLNKTFRPNTDQYKQIKLIGGYYAVQQFKD